MTEEQHKRCAAIIHSHALLCGAGNAIPIPGLGVAADIVTMTTMTLCLASELGGKLTEEAAKGLAIATLKRTILRHPIKIISKELAKFLPLIGQMVSPVISVTLVEATGWSIARELSSRFQRESNRVLALINPKTRRER